MNEGEYKKVLFEALANIVYKREKCCFSLKRTSYKAIHDIKVKVDVQKGPALNFTNKFDNRCANLIQFTFSLTVVIWWPSPWTTMSILVKVCIYG